MKHKITVITDIHGKVLGAVRNEAKTGVYTLSFKAKEHNQQKYHEIEIEEELWKMPAQQRAGELTKRLHQK